MVGNLYIAYVCNTENGTRIVPFKACASQAWAYITLHKGFLVIMAWGNDHGERYDILLLGMRISHSLRIPMDRQDNFG